MDDTNLKTTEEKIGKVIENRRKNFAKKKFKNSKPKICKKSRKELADETGISVSTIKRIESGYSSSLNIKNLTKICTALHINFFSLFEDTPLAREYIISDNLYKINSLDNEAQELVNHLILHLYSDSRTTDNHIRNNLPKLSDTEKLEMLKPIINQEFPFLIKIINLD